MRDRAAPPRGDGFPARGDGLHTDGRHFPRGFLEGGSAIDNVNQRYLNETAYVAVRTSVIPRTYLSLRYRTRVRDYTTDNAASSNFGRQDRREQVTGYLDLAVGRNLVWGLSAGLEEAESTKRGSGFRAKQFGTTLSVMLPES